VIKEAFKSMAEKNPTAKSQTNGRAIYNYKLYHFLLDKI